MSDDAKETHEGYANGSSILDQATVTYAIDRLLSTSSETKTKQADGSVIVRTFHETDPPENFMERRSLKRPGQLPSLLIEAEIPKNSVVVEHEHEAILDAEEDLDVRAYHVARWAVLEARRLQSKFLSVRSVGPGDEAGSCLIRVAFVR